MFLPLQQCHGLLENANGPPPSLITPQKKKPSNSKSEGLSLSLWMGLLVRDRHLSVKLLSFPWSHRYVFQRKGEECERVVNRPHTHTNRLQGTMPDRLALRQLVCSLCLWMVPDGDRRRERNEVHRSLGDGVARDAIQNN